MVNDSAKNKTSLKQVVLEARTIEELVDQVRLANESRAKLRIIQFALGEFQDLKGELLSAEDEMLLFVMVRQLEEHGTTLESAVTKVWERLTSIQSQLHHV